MKKQTNTDQQEPKDRKKEILEWLQIIIAAAVIAFCLNTFVVANSRVPSASMENTIMTGDRILGSRLSYYFGNTPERGDIVIFTHKAEPGKDKTRLVKRVIGLPGETVDIREDKVFINGSDTPLQETYLPEAMDALRGQPRSTAVRLQLAAVYCDYGRVCRQRLEYADACSYYKRALSLLGDLPWPGGVWVYVHYGRAAFALEDHPRARELFQHGYDNAKVSGELWGRTAAAAYTAYYQAMEGDYERAAVSLADAQSCQQRLNSPLEGVILHFVSMHIRSRLDLEQRTGSPLAPLLTYSPESYARQGVRLLSSVPSVFEAEQLSQSLRNGIATQQRYRASELYSKNKHFMAE